MAISLIQTTRLLQIVTIIISKIFGNYRSLACKAPKKVASAPNVGA